MGRDRQERKLKAEKRVESDRDQAMTHDGATKLEKDGEIGPQPKQQ
ncbi:YpzI family protein [Bacillus fonticola]|nr:YpzI family protein [Bacillus fonticola]